MSRGNGMFFPVPRAGALRACIPPRPCRVCAPARHVRRCHVRSVCGAGCGMFSCPHRAGPVAFSPLFPAGTADGRCQQRRSIGLCLSHPRQPSPLAFAFSPALLPPCRKLRLLEVRDPRPARTEDRGSSGLPQQLGENCPNEPNSRPASQQRAKSPASHLPKARASRYSCQEGDSWFSDAAGEALLKPLCP